MSGGADRVVVGVDGSEGSAEALRWAVGVATSRGWAVEAVLAWDLMNQRHIDPGAPFDPHYGEAQASAVLQHDVGSALGEGAAGVTCRPVFGHAANAILEASQGAALLVLGARGLGGFRGLLLGSVSQHCLHHATVPIAIVRQPARDVRPPRLVVGFDGSAHSHTALHWAAEQARVTGAELHVVHAWHPPYVGGEPFVFAPFDAEEMRKAAQAQLDQAVAALDSQHLATPAQPILLEGGAARVLVEAAASASLVVVGARGLGGFAGLLLGSVSDQVVRHAPCPVVVLHDGSSGG